MLRSLVPADAPAVVALLRCAFGAQSVATDPPPAALREDAATIAHAVEHGGGACVVSGNDLTGVVLWAEKENGLYFGRLGVDPAWRGRGVARTLVAAAEAEARRRNLSRVHLQTRLVLRDNRRLFASCGFREAGLRTHDGYAAPTSVVMEKFLDPSVSG